MIGTVLRSTLRFGGANTKGNLFACGVPGPAFLGGGDTPVTGEATARPLIQAANNSYVKLDIPRQHGRPPVAIAIAPDSAIHSCDIAIGGNDGEPQRHRISPGNPLVGDLAAGFALVSVPNSLPGMSQVAATLHWDASDSIPLAGTTYKGWPLRLEMWYGDVPPLRANRRAGYFAHGVFSIASGASGRMRICVDGRTRVDVAGAASAGTSTISMNAIEGRKDPTGTAPLIDLNSSYILPLDDIGSTSLALGTSIFSFYGNPMTVLEIVCAQTVADAIVQFHVKAYDD